MDKANEIAKKVKARVTVDNRKEHTPGWKFNYWELKGVPIRIEIGPKDVKEKQVVLVRRDNGEKISVKEKELTKSVKNILKKIQKNITKKADKSFKDYISKANNLKELKEILERKGGFVKADWCGDVNCADNIKSETSGGAIKGTLFGKKEKISGNCVYCGKKAKEVVYFAKAY